jgi:hypothetical protein
MVALEPARPPAPFRYLVRVMRAARRNLVEFEFAVGGRDLSVQLVLPLPQFREFCSHYGAEVTIDDGALAGWWGLVAARAEAHASAAGGRRTGGGT